MKTLRPGRIPVRALVRQRHWLAVVLWLFAGAGGAVGQMQLILPDAPWRYLDTGTNLGNLWRSVSFDDSAWSTGSGPFGYGEGDEQTLINPGPIRTPFITTYFRTAFPGPVGVPPGAVLQLHIRHDDGAVVYLNGREIWRNNLPAGPVQFNTPAVQHAQDDGQFFTTIEAAADLLLPGLNILAVEVHQATTIEPGSEAPDMSFDAALFLAPALPPFFEQHPQCLTAFLGTNVEFFAFAIGATQLQWLHNDMPIPGATGAVLSLTNLQRLHVGQYRLRASNLSGSVVSEAGELQLELDTAGSIRHELIARAQLDFAGALPLLSGAAGPGGCLPPLFALSHGPAYSYSTYGTTNSTGATNSCGISGTRAKWSFFFATTSERVILRTEGSDFDTILAVFTYNGVSLVQIACDDNGGPNGTSRVEFDMVAGTTYYIAVDGVNGATGNVRLQLDGLELRGPLTAAGGGHIVPMIGRRAQDRTYTLEVATSPAAPSNEWRTVFTTNVSRNIQVWLHAFVTNPPPDSPRLFFNGRETP